jgi:hypothetical protein
VPNLTPVGADAFKDAFLEEVRKQKKFFHGTVVAQAQKIEVDGDRVVFTFTAQHRPLKAQLEQNRPLLETIATQLGGRRMAVVAVEGTAGSPKRGDEAAAAPAAPADDRKAALREQALADSGVQTMLDVFGTEIKDIEEVEPK